MENVTFGTLPTFPFLFIFKVSLQVWYSQLGSNVISHKNFDMQMNTIMDSDYLLLIYFSSICLKALSGLSDN